MKLSEFVEGTEDDVEFLVGEDLEGPHGVSVGLHHQAQVFYQVHFSLEQLVDGLGHKTRGTMVVDRK